MAQCQPDRKHRPARYRGGRVNNRMFAESSDVGHEWLEHNSTKRTDVSCLTVSNGLQQFKAPLGVALNTNRLTFPRFHSRRSELDHRFEKISDLSDATIRNPQALPDFMSFPVIARIKEINRKTEIE